jgi:uncharacterized protein (TIGR02145 family)
MATKIPGKQIETNNILLGGNDQHIKVNGNLDLLGNEIFTNTLPSNKYSYVNKEYVDSIAAGFDPKESCRLATTTDITLSGIQYIDDIQINEGDRILVKNQIDLTKNGIYIASAGTWLRSIDMDSNPVIEVSKGNFTFIETGSTNFTSSWVSTSNVTGSTISVDVDDMIWVKFNSKADLTADDNAITINNNIIQLKIKDGTLTQDINGLFISTAYTYNLTSSINDNTNSISSLSSYTYNTLTQNFNQYTGLTNDNINNLTNNFNNFSGNTNLSLSGLTTNLNSLSSYTYTNISGLTNDINGKVSKTSETLPNFSNGTPLYNWYTVDTGKLAPTGWSVPSESDFNTLITFLGGEIVAGGKLKETGYTHWLNPNTDATNEYDFTAIPSGTRYDYNGAYTFFNTNYILWSSNELDAINGKNLNITYDDSAAYLDNINKLRGCAVRCMTDVNPNVSTITDIDGNVYDVIQIGTQWWLKQDLKTTKYNDGEVIPNITDNTEWGTLSTGALCYYDNIFNTYKPVVLDSNGNVVLIDSNLYTQASEFNNIVTNFNTFSGNTNSDILSLSSYTYSLIISSGGTNFTTGSGLSFNDTILNINLSGDSIAIINNGLKSSVLYTQTGYTNLSGLTGSINTGIGLNYKPAGDSYIMIYLNGINYPLSYGDTTGLFYFSDTGLIREDIDINSVLYFDATNADFSLEMDDLITICYNAII